MRKFAIAAVALACLGLAGCGAVPKAIEIVAGTSVSQKTVGAGIQTFDGVEITATNYLKLPTCADGQKVATGCKNGATVPKLITDVQAGRAARDKLWADAKASPNGVGAKTLYDSVMAAVKVINADLAH